MWWWCDRLTAHTWCTHEVYSSSLHGVVNDQHVWWRYRWRICNASGMDWKYDSTPGPIVKNHSSVSNDWRETGSWAKKSSLRYEQIQLKEKVQSIITAPLLFIVPHSSLEGFISFTRVSLSLWKNCQTQTTLRLSLSCPAAAPVLTKLSMLLAVKEASTWAHRGRRPCITSGNDSENKLLNTQTLCCNFHQIEARHERKQFAIRSNYGPIMSIEGW